MGLGLAAQDEERACNRSARAGALQAHVLAMAPEPKEARGGGPRGLAHCVVSIGDGSD